LAVRVLHKAFELEKGPEAAWRRATMPSIWPRLWRPC